MMPRPPLSAMAMAMRASVTVSMSDEIIGMLSCNSSASVTSNCVSRGRISEYNVASVTSSNVGPMYSEILPRDTQLDVTLADELQLNIPIISSDMDTVTEA